MTLSYDEGKGTGSCRFYMYVPRRSNFTYVKKEVQVFLEFVFFEFGRIRFHVGTFRYIRTYIPEQTCTEPRIHIVRVHNVRM